MAESNAESLPTAPLRVLTPDGGGAKGFYTLGVLKEIEAMVGCPLHQKFDLVYGTSTGAIIASLIALGYRVDAMHALYRKYVPSVMSQTTRQSRCRVPDDCIANRSYALLQARSLLVALREELTRRKNR